MISDTSAFSQTQAESGRPDHEHWATALRGVSVYITAFNDSKLYCLVTEAAVKGKGKVSSLDIAPLTILNSGALQPRKWLLTGIDCSTAAQAVAAQSLR